MYLFESYLLEDRDENLSSTQVIDRDENLFQMLEGQNQWICAGQLRC